MVTGNAGADEGLREGDHTHWACKQKARLFIPARARRIRSRARCSPWAMPGAGRATKRLLCAGRLRLGDRAGETGARKGARGGAQGEAAIWQVQQADPERSARTAELQAPRARPADIRARRSRPPRQRPQIGGAVAPRGPAGPALARAPLSPPLGRAPRCHRASSALSREPERPGWEPAGSEGSGPVRAALGLVACVPEAPRAASCSRTAPPRRVEARKQAKSLPGARGASARPDELPSGRCPGTSGPRSPLGGGRRDDVATRRRERRGSALGPNPRGRQKLGKAAGPTPPQGTRLRLNPGGAAPSLAEWRGCAGGGRGASRCLPSGMLNRGAH